MTIVKVKSRVGIVLIAIYNVATAIVKAQLPSFVSIGGGEEHMATDERRTVRHVDSLC